MASESSVKNSPKWLRAGINRSAWHTSLELRWRRTSTNKTEPSRRRDKGSPVATLFTRKLELRSSMSGTTGSNTAHTTQRIQQRLRRNTKSTCRSYEHKGMKHRRRHNTP
ncbi:hypothetical protein F2Q69_00019624 [Brassica cretica]|uniref:Uncharacterized protein n=1 Tax=Brassica cretica TaxID=69181 RepID=A0A8S9QA15_BRACR|nr:hypothetical protein F2Q69_00019624 [Brassica cretica]